MKKIPSFTIDHIRLLRGIYGQNRLPNERIHFHHTPITEEFRKILRHCFFGRSGRRTGVADENGGLGCVVLRGHRIQKRRLDQVRAIVHELS